MTESSNGGTHNSAPLEGYDRQWSNGCAGSPLGQVPDANLARLRRSLDQLPPAVQWEEMRSRILVALSDLPDEHRPCPALATHVSADFHIGRRECSRGPATRQEQCFASKTETSIPGSLLFASHLLRALWRIPKLVWMLSAIMLVMAAPLLLYRSNPANPQPLLLPPVAQVSGALTKSFQAPVQSGLAARLAARPAAEGPAMITALQHQAAPAAVSVVIFLTAPAEYEIHRLTRPARVYIDFHNTRLSPRLKGEDLGAGKPCLRKYRVAPRAPRIARIAFETGPACDYSAELTAATPARLVLLLRPVAPTAGP